VLAAELPERLEEERLAELLVRLEQECLAELLESPAAEPQERPAVGLPVLLVEGLVAERPRLGS
jgi:hypothetical protein